MTKSIDITQRVQFNCDYLVADGDHYSIQPCLYTVDVTVRSSNSVTGRVMDFADIRHEIEQVVPHNKFIVSLTNRHMQDAVQSLVSAGVAVEYVSFEVCAENICSWIADMLQGRLYLAYQGIQVTEVMLNENGVSTARWRS